MLQKITNKITAKRGLEVFTADIKLDTKLINVPNIMAVARILKLIFTILYFLLNNKIMLDINPIMISKTLEPKKKMFVTIISGIIINHILIPKHNK